MEDQDATVLPFPVHRRSTLAETLEGFPGRAGTTLPGSRSERRVTVLYSERRGWADVAARAGQAAAGLLLTQVVEKGVEALSEFGATDVRVGGGGTQPVISASFD